MGIGTVQQYRMARVSSHLPCVIAALILNAYDIGKELLMPELTRVLSEEDLARRGGMPRLDLATYVNLIERVRDEQGVGGIVTLGPGEGQRTEKRRLSLAAKQQGYKLT